MAPRNVDKGTAEGVVRESLGLSADDLGMNPAEDSFSQGNDLEDNVEDDNNDNIGGTQDLHDDSNDDFGQTQQQPRQNNRPVEDDLSVKPTQTQPKPGLHHRAEVRTDAKGNIINKSTGQIVARAGKEARMYQQLHKTNKAYEGLQAQHADVERRLNRAIEIGTGLFEKLKELQANQSEVAPQRYGLSNAEAIEAMNFAKEAKVNPVETIKKLLTRAASSGIDLSSIGLSGGNFDPKSLMDLVRSEIGNAMNPLRERSQRETAKEQEEREAKERDEAAKAELNTFLGQNPEAREYLPVFQRIYSQPQFQHMSLGEVWARLQLNLMMRRQSTPTNQRPANQRNSRKPLPSGRRMPPGQNGTSELASVDTSYDDIVRSVIG